MLPLTYIPLLAGIIAFSIWARNIDPPLSWWNIGIVVGGALLFLIISFLAFHRVRRERDKEKKQIEQLRHIKAGDVISGRDINLSCLFQQLETDSLSNVTFEHCTLRGPCTVLIEGGEVKGNQFTGRGEFIDRVFVADPERKYGGIGILAHCKILYCKIDNLSLLLDKALLKKFLDDSVKV